ncbi:hypothetical protein C8J57DRAFT_1068778, partial [Mycena rebaudengoi]
ACRAALANYPCPKCLAPKPDLQRLTKKFNIRTPVTMKAVVQKAHAATTKKEKEEILKDNGLRGIKVPFLWEFRFSDPYAAYSYDTLHSDDLGKWGHHLWDLLLESLDEVNGKGTFAKNMRELARWPSLKHFNQVITIHIVADIRSKGTTNHGSARPGEGFQQEAAEASGGRPCSGSSRDRPQTCEISRRLGMLFALPCPIYLRPFLVHGSYQHTSFELQEAHGGVGCRLL